LQALEIKLSKVVFDDEVALQASTTSSRVPTLDLMLNIATQNRVLSNQGDDQPLADLHALDALERDSETSDTEVVTTDDEGEHLSLEELAKAAKQVQKLLKRITKLQHSFPITQEGKTYKKKRVNRIYQRFCRNWELNTAIHIPFVYPDRAMPSLPSSLPPKISTARDASTKITAREERELRQKEMLRKGMMSIHEADEFGLVGETLHQFKTPGLGHREHSHDIPGKTSESTSNRRSEPYPLYTDTATQVDTEILGSRTRFSSTHRTFSPDMIVLDRAQELSVYGTLPGAADRTNWSKKMQRDNTSDVIMEEKVRDAMPQAPAMMAPKNGQGQNFSPVRTLMLTPAQISRMKAQLSKTQYASRIAKVQKRRPDDIPSSDLEPDEQIMPEGILNTHWQPYPAWSNDKATPSNNANATTNVQDISSIEFHIADGVEVTSQEATSDGQLSDGKGQFDSSSAHIFPRTNVYDASTREEVILFPPFLDPWEATTQATYELAPPLGMDHRYSRCSASSPSSDQLPSQDEKSHHSIASGSHLSAAHPQPEGNSGASAENPWLYVPRSPLGENSAIGQTQWNSGYPAPHAQGPPSNNIYGVMSHTWVAPNGTTSAYDNPHISGMDWQSPSQQALASLSDAALTVYPVSSAMPQYASQGYLTTDSKTKRSRDDDDDEDTYRPDNIQGVDIGGLNGRGSSQGYYSTPPAEDRMFSHQYTRSLSTCTAPFSVASYATYPAPLPVSYTEPYTIRSHQSIPLEQSASKDKPVLGHSISIRPNRRSSSSRLNIVHSDQVDDDDNARLHKQQAEHWDLLELHGSEQRRVKDAGKFTLDPPGTTSSLVGQQFIGGWGLDDEPDRQPRKNFVSARMNQRNCRKKVRHSDKDTKKIEGLSWAASKARTDLDVEVASSLDLHKEKKTAQMIPGIPKVPLPPDGTQQDIHSVFEAHNVASHLPIQTNHHIMPFPISSGDQIIDQFSKGNVVPEKSGSKADNDRLHEIPNSPPIVLAELRRHATHDKDLEIIPPKDHEIERRISRFKHLEVEQDYSGGEETVRKFRRKKKRRSAGVFNRPHSQDVESSYSDNESRDGITTTGRRLSRRVGSSPSNQGHAAREARELFETAQPCRAVSATFGPPQDRKGESMTDFRGHKRAPSEIYSDISSAHASPYLTQQDSFEDNQPSPLLNAQADPQLFQDPVMQFGQFTLNDGSLHISPGHSPHLSPRLIPQQQQQQQQQALPQFQPGSFGLDPSMNNQFGQLDAVADPPLLQGLVEQQEKLSTAVTDAALNVHEDLELSLDLEQDLELCLDLGEDLGSAPPFASKLEDYASTPTKQARDVLQTRHEAGGTDAVQQPQDIPEKKKRSRPKYLKVFDDADFKSNKRNSSSKEDMVTTSNDATGSEAFERDIVDILLDQWTVSVH
jgi:hypothetical protein